ncbi:MAG: hypothetical protein E3J64_02270, partial [Anaerolineales bacterium]
EGLAQLSRRERDVIAPRFGSGLANTAIAPVVGTSAGNVAVVLHRAMRKLHKYVEEAYTASSVDRSSVNGQ